MFFEVWIVLTRDPPQLTDIVFGQFLLGAVLPKVTTRNRLMLSQSEKTHLDHCQQIVLHHIKISQHTYLNRINNIFKDLCLDKAVLDRFTMQPLRQYIWFVSGESSKLFEFNHLKYIPYFPVSLNYK